jgi:hypothetical protein
MRRPGSRILAAVVLALVCAGPAAAQEKPTRIGVKLAINHVSRNPGPIDPDAALLERKLRNDFRYQSVRVLDRRELSLGLDEVGSVVLPSGRTLKVRPRNVKETGVLMRVEVEGLLRTSLRVPNHHQVVIGAQEWQDGKLVITLEPDY